MTLGLREIARALGGEVSGAQVLAPGPNHDRRDRSLSVKWSASSPDGFIVHSFAGDGFQDCRDYVRVRLGIDRSFAPTWREAQARRAGAVIPAPDDEGRRIERARALWREAVDPRRTIVEKYMGCRSLELGGSVAGSVLRYHEACPWREGEQTIRVPAMLAAMRSIASNEITAVHRTRLTADGVKVDRRMLGVAIGAAIKLDADDTVTHGLTIGEGIETCQSARQFGICPTWSLASTSLIAGFPVLAGVECLTILAEHDEASAKAVQACAQRWHNAGREVLINRSTRGNDLNDAIRGAA